MSPLFIPRFVSQTLYLIFVMEKVKAAMKKLEEEEKRAEMLLKMDERKRPYNSMTETKVSPPPYLSGSVSYLDSGSAWNRVYLASWVRIQTFKMLLSAQVYFSPEFVAIRHTVPCRTVADKNLKCNRKY
jgi:hypothetical protein